MPKLNALYDDLFSNGKGFRSKLIQQLSDHLGLSKKQVHLLAQTIEFIHNASLLHDDLVDRSHLRKQTCRLVEIYPRICGVSWGLFVSSSHGEFISLRKFTATSIHSRNDFGSLEGEWIQDSLVRDWNVQLNQLDEVHKLKTASLFKWCYKTPFLAKEIYRDDVHQYLEELGG